MSSTLIETININADDFTDNFLTCPTCIGPYDEGEHAPKLLPCSHTLCRSCLERIASSATPVNSLNLANVVNAAVAGASGGGGGGGGGSGSGAGGGSSQQATVSNQLNSISRSVAAADAAHADVAANGCSVLCRGRRFLRCRHAAHNTCVPTQPPKTTHARVPMGAPGTCS